MKRNAKDLSISSILMLSYVIVAVLFVVSTCVSIVAVHQNAAVTEEFYQRPYQVAKSAVSLRNDVEEMSGYLGQYVNIEDAAERTEVKVVIDQLSAERETEQETISTYFVADQNVLAQFNLANESLIALRNDVMEAAEAGDLERAQSLYDQSYLPQKDITMDLADDIVAAAEKKAVDFVARSKELENVTSLIIAAIGLVMVAVAIFMWRRITRAIAVPVHEIEQAAKRVADGDLTADIPVTSGNELGVLAASFNKTIATLRMTVQRLSDTAEQVERSSSQMSDGSQAIAQGSAEQAMAIEELAANVQGITQVVEVNNESVLVANENTADVLAAVEHSNDQIAKTVQVIGDIKTSTRNISQLANAIEDISFQTNILALNASVEAARAGDAGRGFAIVAEEIRRLATQVSEASRAADELAVRASASVESGSALIEVTSDNMEGAVAATEGVKEMMSAIAQASAQQLEAVSQIQESMDSLSDVVQENSAASEESAAIGEELAEQARVLKKLIDRFTFEAPATGADGGAS
ncbi:methyl-accepting chemotaxis protein [Arabiibacter massiliensis]|uniref:methyl-accepting chemotaxis protein n=1 Tax=Arabiibacter massiliensis TaxID=1870985 RepID=UPI0009B9BE7C|nr:methyl-accepting chemotaxis protein [Arabiibacter massiliensis]